MNNILCEIDTEFCVFWRQISHWFLAQILGGYDNNFSKVLLEFCQSEVIFRVIQI